MRKKFNKKFTEEELAAIGEKIRAAIPPSLTARGYFLFRRQIREKAGVTEEEWNAYTLSLVQKRVDTPQDPEVKAIGLDRVKVVEVNLDSQPRRFGRWLRSLFRPSTQLT